MALLELNTEDLFAAEMMVTTYQKQYFFTESIDHAIEFVRDIANSIQRPFSVRFNPYTQTVDVLNNQDKILDMAKELRGDLCIVANALKKVQENDGEADAEFMTNFLTAGLDLTPYGSRCTTPIQSPPMIVDSGDNSPSDCQGFNRNLLSVPQPSG